MDAVVCDSENTSARETIQSELLTAMQLDELSRCRDAAALIDADLSQLPDLEQVDVTDETVREDQQHQLECVAAATSTDSLDALD